MRIGIDIAPLSRTPTGVGYYVRHLAHELVQLAPPDQFRGFAACARPLDKAAVPFRYTQVPLPSRFMYRVWNLCGHPCVDTLLGGVQLFHATNYVLPPLRRARSVLTIHDLGFLLDADWCNPKAGVEFRRTIQRDAVRADLIVTCSKATRSDVMSLLGISGEKIRVVYNAADAAFVPMDRETARLSVLQSLGIGAPYFLFVSTVEARKNVLGLLSAFAEADVPQKLLIVGAHGWGSKEVLERAAELRLEKRVVFAGYLPDRSLFPALYSAADAFVFPSWYEGFGLAVLEAMACGCPVICSNTSSLPEVGGDAPLYAAPDDIEDWTRKMELVAGDAQLRTLMGEKGLAQKTMFSWKKCAEETLACYQSLL